MHMWMWFGFDLGEFLFAGLSVSTRWAFALTWIVLFITAVLFEASKVYLARVQRAAHKKLSQHRSGERRNLLCHRDQATMEPSTSRDASASEVSRWASFRVRTLVNTHQTLVFLAHNVVGYLLMLAVMVYNVQLMFAVVFGMMLGYFLFGTQLTRMQMQCFGTKRVVICTPECDDTAENSTPPLLNSSTALDSEIFTCQTRTCIQPSHYFRASTSQDGANSCHFGAKSCPSKVARVKKLQASSQRCHRSTDKDNPSVEDDQQLLREERPSCCKKQEPPPPENTVKCCNSSQINTTILVHENIEQGHTDVVERQDAREDSPQISCCHNSKSTSESQEQIVNID